VRVAIMGAPGAGKGTQAKLLAERKHIPHVSTGDILREAQEKGTTLGKKVRAYMDRGQLVPDDVVVGIVQERLRNPDATPGYILDGFPRTVAQARALDGLGERLGAVIALDVPEAELLRRLGGRRTCRACGTMFHLAFDPPRSPDRCDRCGGELVQREDDREDTIRRRLEVYHEQTAPVLQHYRDAGLLREVAGLGTREEVYGRVAASLG
jgi:adenylate kinase